MNNTFMTFSLGCKVNSYECSAIATRLLEMGYIEDKDNPEVIIINTCSVTSTADQKCRQHIRKYRQLFPNAFLVVMGCYAQGNADYIWNEIKPNVLVGTANRDKIVSYILNRTNIKDINKDFRSFNYEELGITSYCENTRAYLKIQDGCNNFCSYCIVPYRRGKMRSRLPEYIYKEASCLIEKGYQEIVISGIDIGSYGKDLGYINFSTLIDNLLSIDNLPSLRISSVEASQIDDKFIELFKNKTNFAKHLHIPLQSGSETVLKRMNRKYDINKFRDIIFKLRESCPDFALSTDVIVGFPGETQEEFEQTYNFIKECGFNMLHVFPYSPRSGTLAASMPNQIEPSIKKERVKRLIDLSKTLWDQYVDKFIETNIDVLVEQYDSINKFNIGHTNNYIKVSIPSLEGKVGEHITVKLDKSMIVSE